MQTELRSALNPLGGRQAEGLLAFYSGWAVSHINRSADGYSDFRKAHKIDASKHLVRSAIESVIRLRALHNTPELLSRIAFEAMPVSEADHSHGPRLSPFEYHARRSRSENTARLPCP